MPEKTKRKENFEKAAEKENVEPADPQHEAVAKDNWSADQREKSYYYDDGYGYEVYNPDEEDED